MSVKAVGAEESPPAEKSPFGNLAAGSVRKVQKSGPTVAKPPMMQELCRILGKDRVLSIFPDGLMESVDYAYTFWMNNPDSYIDVAFETEEELADVVTVMRAYAECAPKGPYTIRTVATDDPKVLAWRAQNRRGRSVTE
jgi:hypothetical protein